jgi:hypothetical protein
MKLRTFLLLFTFAANASISAVQSADKKPTPPDTGEEEKLHACHIVGLPSRVRRKAFFDNKPAGQQDSLTLMEQALPDKPGSKYPIRIVLIRNGSDMNARAAFKSMHDFCNTAVVPDDKKKKEIGGRDIVVHGLVPGEHGIH